MSKQRRIVDLTYTLAAGMPTFPTHWHPIVEIAPLGRHGIENRSTHKVVLGTHTGTHCDAPLHFIKGGGTVEQLDLETLIGPARLVDLTAFGPGQEVSAQALAAAAGPALPPRLVLRYDWSWRWGSLEFFTEHPYLSESAAHWLLEQGVRLLAMDTPNPDNPRHGWKHEPDSPVHHILLGKQVILVEYLCNLDQLSTRDFELLVCPMKILGVDGAPVRCLAREEVQGV